MSEKEEKTRKTFFMAKQKISQLMGKQVSPQHKHESITAFMCSFTAGTPSSVIGKTYDALIKNKILWQLHSHIHSGMYFTF